MRITAAILLIFSLHVTAKSVSQTITLSGKDIPLKTVFDEIRKQSGYVVFYNNEIIANAKPVTINAKEEPLLLFLDATLGAQGLGYVVENKTIVIKKALLDLGLNLRQTASDLTPPPILFDGIVVGKNGDPLAGVNVMIRGTNSGTTSDKNGKFSIVVEPGAEIEITSVGYEKKIFKIPPSRETIIIQLEIASTLLDEVQYIAYGQTSKRISTGNVSSVKAPDLVRQSEHNVLLALEGRVPGLFITQTTGLPGSGVTVRIQGEKNSIEKGNDPLYVINGVPYMFQLLPNLGGILGGSGGPVIDGVASGSGSPLSFINPADIESIEVLKDADATAIYGSRAANGAILITTKKGSEGRTKFDVNIQHGWGKVAKRIDLLNNNQYLQMRKEAYFINDGNTTSSFDYPYQYDINGFWDSARSTDWQKELIGGVAKYSDAQITVSGGSETTTFSVGAGYHRQTTVFPTDFSDRKGSIQISLNNSSLNKKFNLQLSSGYLSDNSQLPGSDLTAVALRLAPNAPAILNADGSLNWMPDAAGFSSWRNPLASLYSTYNNKTTSLISSANIRYTLLKGIDIKFNLGFTDMRVDEYMPTPLVSEAPENRPYTPRIALYSDSRNNSWIVEPQLTYKDIVAKGNLEILFGSTFQQVNGNYAQFFGMGYNTDAVMADMKSASTLVVFNNAQSEYRYNALFGRLNYNWSQKYILNLTARRDGSSRFGPKNQFHNFGAVGLGWVFSRENIFENDILTFGKLRASYGTTGSDQIGNYQYLNLYTPTYDGLSYQNISGLEVAGIPNPYIAWEETKKLQIGTDLGFLNDKVILTVNYYRNRSSNLLLPYLLPNLTGFGSIAAVNFPATIQNSGWEFSLNSTNIKRNMFNWTTNFNLTIPKNKLISFPKLEQSTYANQYIIGQPITIAKLYNYEGVDPITGVYHFLDSKGQLTSNPDPVSDRTVIINSATKFYGGIQNSITFKNIEANFLLQFVKQMAANNMFGSVIGGFINANQPISVWDRWQKQGDIAPIQRYNSTFAYFSQISKAQLSDAAFSDASFIRLKNISLTYSMPESIIRKMTLQNLKVYIEGQNLVTITNYKGLDPENRSFTALPPLRVIVIGLKAGF